MEKYYTRACNFYFGKTSKEKIKKNLSFSLGGNSLISFDSIEIISRKSKKKINIKNIHKLPLRIKKKVLLDLKNIYKNKKILGLKLKDLPLLMGVLNLTPDSFSDGGKYNKTLLAKKKIDKLIKEGAKIIDLGGESEILLSSEALSSKPPPKLKAILDTLLLFTSSLEMISLYACANQS